MIVFDWFLYNPIASMYGPYFLLFYAIVLVATLVLCRNQLRALDTTAALPPHPIPARLDPYSIAYLRGGENELARTVIFSLIERGYLRPTGSDEPQVEPLPQKHLGLWRSVSIPSVPQPAVGADQKIEQSPQPPDTCHLSPLERRVFEWFHTPLKAGELFQAGRPTQLLPLCEEYCQDLQDEKMLTGSDLREQARRIRNVGAAVIVGLGGFKLMVALTTGHPNVAGLVVMGIIAFAILYGVTATERLTNRGRNYLEQLRKAFERLQKERVHGIRSERTADFTLPLLVGVFGVGVLAGTPYDYLPQIFHRASSSNTGGGGCGSSCGAGCGGGGCGGGGCGGGCGGCGGG